MTQTHVHATALAGPPSRRSAAWCALYAALTAALLLVFCAATVGIAWRRLIYAPYAGLWLVRLAPLAVLSAATVTFASLLRELGLVPRTVEWGDRLTASWRRTSALIIAAAFLLSIAAVWALRAFPNSGDEYAYLWLARTFLAGRVNNPLPPIPDLFVLAQTGFSGSRWVTVYNPGWPALLAGGMAIDLPPWLISTLAGGLLLALAATLGYRRSGPLGAVLAAALIGATPFFLFNAASYFEHVPAAAAGLLFCWRARLFLDRPSARTAVLCGAALGALGLIRAVDAALFALPFAGEFVWRARGRHYRLAPALGLAGAPFLAALLGYYRLTIGAFVPHLPAVAASVKFGAAPVAAAGGLAIVLPRLLLALSRLVALAEWTSPLLVIGAAAGFVAIARQRRMQFIDLVFPLFVIAYLFVPYDGGNQYGPRYYFEGFPCLVLTLVAWLTPLLCNRERPQRTAYAWFSLLAHGAICALVFVFLCAGLRQVVNQRMDLYDQVSARRLHNAIVVVRAGTSSIYRMYPPDLIRNGIDAHGDVIYVLDVPRLLPQLQRLYPGRKLYVYDRAASQPSGTLRPLDLAGE